MNERLTAIDLDSYRLAQYADQVSCFVCNGPNRFDPTLCRHCGAPMALTHQIHHQKVRPALMAVLGAAGVGKSVYLGMLFDMLCRERRGPTALARGAFSVSVPEETVSALVDLRFPDPTPLDPRAWHWVHCRLETATGRRGREVVVPDLAGQAILDEIDEPRTHPAIESLLHRAAGTLLLVDAPAAEAGDHQQEYVALKLLSALGEAADNIHDRRSERPLAVVFTKKDDCTSDLVDPESFARQYVSGLWRQCQQRYRKLQFFACSISGATIGTADGTGGVRIVPLRIEPDGVVEPFFWLVDSLGR